MASFCAQAFVSELAKLVHTLREEDHPALYRFEPFYKEEYVREIQNSFATINSLRQELIGIRCSIQNLTMLVVSQQQLVPMCHQMAVRRVRPYQPSSVVSVSGLVPDPSMNFSSARRKTVAHHPTRSQNRDVLMTAIQESDIPYYDEGSNWTSNLSA